MTREDEWNKWDTGLYVVLEKEREREKELECKRNFLHLQWFLDPSSYSHE